jgi:hypothetical protein
VKKELDKKQQKKKPKHFKFFYSYRLISLNTDFQFNSVLISLLSNLSISFSILSAPVRPLLQLGDLLPLPPLPITPDTT